MQMEVDVVDEDDAGCGQWIVVLGIPFVEPQGKVDDPCKGRLVAQAEAGQRHGTVGRPEPYAAGFGTEYGRPQNLYVFVAFDVREDGGGESG